MARRCPWIKRIEILREKIIETATNSNFVFPISLQLYGVNLKYIIHSLKCLRCTTSICKDIRIRKLEFLARTPFHQYLLVRTYNGHFYKHFCPWDTR